MPPYQNRMTGVWRERPRQNEAILTWTERTKTLLGTKPLIKRVAIHTCRTMLHAWYGSNGEIGMSFFGITENEDPLSQRIKEQDVLWGWYKISVPDNNATRVRALLSPQSLSVLPRPFERLQSGNVCPNPRELQCTCPTPSIKPEHATNKINETHHHFISDNVKMQPHLTSLQKQRPFTCCIPNHTIYAIHRLAAPGRGGGEFKLRSAPWSCEANRHTCSWRLLATWHCSRCRRLGCPRQRTQFPGFASSRCSEAEKKKERTLW